MAVACDGQKRWAYPHSRRRCRVDPLTVEVDYATVRARCANWTIVTNVRTVPNRVFGAPRRIDFRVEGSDDAHGVVGQNLRRPRDGKTDAYPSSGHFTTSAQAEGAIDGEYREYIVDAPFDWSFRYTRFNATRTETDAIWTQQAYAE